DVEAVLAREAVGRAAEADRDVAQRPVVHVHHALPLDAAHVDAELVAVADVVVDHRRQQVVGERNGGKIAREVQVDVFHRHDLRVAAAGRAALDAEHGPQRGLAQADEGLLADVVERVAQADRGGGLALARGRRADRGDQDQLAVLLRLQRVQVLERNLGLVVAVGLQVLLGDAEFLQRDFGDALQFRRLGDIDVRWHVQDSRKERKFSSHAVLTGLDSSQAAQQNLPEREMPMTSRTFAVAAFAAGILLSAGAHAQQGVSATTVVIGQSAPLTGANAELGNDIRNGVLAYFAKVNAAGGVHGRKLELNT